MEIELPSFESIRISKSEKAIFDVLKATLLFPAGPQAKCDKLIADFTFFYKSKEKNNDKDDSTDWGIWVVVIDLVRCILPGHPWQDNLLDSLARLCKRDGAIYEHTHSLLWTDLPYLGYYIREQWLDPTVPGFLVDDEEESKQYTKWKNFNSFAARLKSRGFRSGMHYAFWQMETALEEPPVKGSAMECRLWVACEWIIFYAKPIFRSISEEELEDESEARMFRPGPLCKDISPWSVERWEFWKKRFVEFAADLGSLEIENDSAIMEKISDALNSMSAAEEGVA